MDEFVLRCYNLRGAELIEFAMQWVRHSTNNADAAGTVEYCCLNEDGARTAVGGHVISRPTMITPHSPAAAKRDQMGANNEKAVAGLTWLLLSLHNFELVANDQRHLYPLRCSTFSLSFEFSLQP
jgi:hypothetical protein